MHTRDMTNLNPRFNVSAEGSEPRVTTVRHDCRDTLGAVAVHVGGLTLYMSVADAETLRAGLVETIDALLVQAAKDEA